MAPPFTPKTLPICFLLTGDLVPIHLPPDGPADGGTRLVETLAQIPEIWHRFQVILTTYEREYRQMHIYDEPRADGHLKTCLKKLIKLAMEYEPLVCQLKIAEMRWQAKGENWTNMSYVMNIETMPRKTRLECLQAVRAAESTTKTCKTYAQMARSPGHVSGWERFQLVAVACYVATNAHVHNARLRQMGRAPVVIEQIQLGYDQEGGWVDFVFKAPDLTFDWVKMEIEEST